MATQQINILLVEDNPGDARLIRELLNECQHSGTPYALRHVENLHSAIAVCAGERFDAVLLDLNLPDSTGLATIEQFNIAVSGCPLVVLTGLNDNVVAFECVQHGAQSYVTKNECTPTLLMRAIHYAMERKRVEEEYKHLAMHDSLTGLPNRALFYDRLSQAIRHSVRRQAGLSAKWKTAVMLLDLDNFKSINDTFGHEQGDQVLQQTAQRLKASLRESDTVARLGGDEFILVIEGVSEQEDCLAVTQKILRGLYEPLVLAGMEISLSASIGISLCPDDAEDIETLIRHADAAMYKAKRGKSHISFHQQRGNE
jgi:diguanylate cyclase (GGDEF)-like protein